ncbi:MAG: HD domain-containing protein [Candidatus Saganbacteria bacterium]|nr:HD domain-containing protein [Candidatus Saganbacteria bacterium]
MFKLPCGVLYIIKALNEKGFKAFLVGGSVRDLLMKTPVYDWDITTSARPEQVTALFEKVVPTGLKYGTVTVMLEDGDFEVTTFRSDEKYSDGRHPDSVTFTADIKDDLSRRDFTVNAIAYDAVNSELIDPFNGQTDINSKLLKAVGDPLARFLEDGLRSMRACRLGAKLGFGIEQKTFDAIPKAAGTFKKVAPERIREELIKMMSADKPSVGIEYMRKSGLLKIVMQELEECLGVEQPKPYHVYDVYHHSIYSCDHAPKELPMVRLAALFHDIAKPSTKKEDTFYGHESESAIVSEKIMKRLKFSNDNIEEVSNLIKNHMFNYTDEWTDSAVRRFINRVGIENIEDLFMLRIADMKAMERDVDPAYLKELKNRIEKVIEKQDALSVSQLKIDGQDVMRELNIGQGPKVGEVLGHLLEKVLDDPSLNEREKLIEMIRRP